jgi:hypothetical protein
MSPGKKVICIDASIKSGKEDFVKYAFPNWLKEGHVYTVRKLVENQGIVPGLLLKEIINPPIYIHLIKVMQEPAFRLDRFKELEEEELEEDLLAELDLEMTEFVY